MDFASIAGILSGISLIVAAIFLRGNLTNFLNIPGLMIVLVGTIASTLLTFPLRDVIQAFQAAFFVLYEKKVDPNDMVKTIISLSNISRKQGLFTLGKVKTNHPILKKGCDLIADGADRRSRGFHTIHIPQMLLDVSCRHALGIHRHHFLFYFC